MSASINVLLVLFLSVCAESLEHSVMKVDLRNMAFVSTELDCGNVCPACPKVITLICTMY